MTRVEPTPPTRGNDSQLNIGWHWWRERSVALVYSIAAGLAVLTAYAERSLGPAVWWSAIGVALLLSIDYTMIPRYARARSGAPVRHLVQFGAAFLLVGSIAGKLSPDVMRACAVVFLASGGCLTLFLVASRLRRPRRTVLLYGDVTGVSRLAEPWGGMDQVDIRGVVLAPAAMDSAAMGSAQVERPTEIAGIPVVGGIAEAHRIVVDQQIDEVVVVPGPAVGTRDVRLLGWALEDTQIELVVAADVHGALPHRVEPRLMGEQLMLSLKSSRRPLPLRALKLALDVTGAFVLLVVLAPLMAVVALAVRLDSRGPVLFRQQRIGRRGRPFTMLKFRTMVVNAEELKATLVEQNEASGPLFKMVDDPRITRVGRLLRRTSLDELPQLFNVVAGQMSLIGPRPCLPEESESFGEWERRRLDVKPGITGAWQTGGRSALPWNEGVLMDLDYVDNHTFTWDLQIAAKTLRAVFRQEGH